MLPLNPFDRSPAPRHGLPLARGRFPKLGHLPAMIWDLPALCRWAHSHYGPCAWLDRGGGNLILQVAGDDTFEVLKNKQVDSSALYEAAPTFLGRSMIVMDGPDHRRVRGATGQAFTPSGLDRAKVGAIIAEVVTARVEGWPSHRELMVARQTREMALEIIFRIIGIPPHDVPTWRHMFEELTLSAVNIPFDLPGSPARRGKRAATWLDARMRTIIERVRREGDHDSLVGAMVHGRDETARGLTEEELVDNLRLLVLAGHETTASVLAWAMLLLAEHPAAWRRLCDEAISLDAVPTSAQHQAPFAEGVFREALRLYPPVSNTIRKTHSPLEIAGRAVPIGSVLSINLHEISRDPARYPEPHAFRPERWVELGRRPTAHETCQFGGGPHFCLGYHVALLEGVVMLTSAARRLAAAGLSPRPAGPLPRARYVPLIHPPRGSQLRLERG